MVDEVIFWECRTFFAFFLTGVVLGFEYDLIRAFRIIIPHRYLWIISVEDILYWIYVSVFVFSRIFELNNGGVRLFIFLAMLFGAVLYNQLLSRQFIRLINFAVDTIRKTGKSIRKICRKQ